MSHRENIDPRSINSNFKIVANLTQKADQETLKRLQCEAAVAKLSEQLKQALTKLEEHQLSHKQQTNEIFVLKKSLARARAESTTQLDRKRIADGEASVLREQLIEARKQNSCSLVRSKECAEHERSSFEMERKVFRNEIEGLKERLASSQKQLLESNENTRIWSTKYQQQAQRNLGLTHELTQQRERLIESQIEKKRLEQWRDQVKQKAIDMRTTDQINESLRDQLRHFDKSQRELVEKCRDLELQLLDKNSEVAALKREFDELTHELVESERDKASLMKRLDRKVKEAKIMTREEIEPSSGEDSIEPKIVKTKKSSQKTYRKITTNE